MIIQKARNLLKKMMILMTTMKMKRRKRRSSLKRTMKRNVLNAASL
jgi:hypothetical protein